MSEAEKDRFQAQLLAEVAVLTELVRVLSDKVAQQALQALHDENERLGLYEQEPVGRFAKFSDGLWREVTEYSNGVMLYTTPPQRTWVGLTDEQVEAVAEEFGVGGWICDFARAIEAVLKEKNDC